VALEEGKGLRIVVLGVVVLRDVQLSPPSQPENCPGHLLSHWEQGRLEDVHVAISSQGLSLIQEVELALLVVPHSTPHEARVETSLL